MNTRKDGLVKRLGVTVLHVEKRTCRPGEKSLIVDDVCIPCHAHSSSQSDLR